MNIRTENLKQAHLFPSFLRYFHVVPFNDGLWHHICMSWENSKGLWDVIIDGRVIAHGSAWHQTLNLRPGKLVVGQRQSIYGGGFNVSESFSGKVSSVNLWDAKIGNNKIKEMARNCSQGLGNVTDWRMFRCGVQGDVEIHFPKSCVSHGMYSFACRVESRLFLFNTITLALFFFFLRVLLCFSPLHLHLQG